jgi:hypothetical protein
MNIFDKQIYHYIALILLVFGVYALADDSALLGQLWGVSTCTWLWLSVAMPILHQVYVWFAWRGQLECSLISRIFGESGFKVYTFGFLILWVPGLIFFSKAALLAACFNHVYIWVHYYTTELPDIRFIYGSPGNREQS